MTFTVPEPELMFRTSRAGGPGGQHVNKASTRVEALWNVAESPSLSGVQRELVLRKLASRIDSRGILQVAADERRSQLRNRVAAVERLNALVAKALEQPRPRKKTRIPAATRKKRLENKRKRSTLKRDRRPVDRDE